VVGFNGSRLDPALAYSIDPLANLRQALSQAGESNVWQAGEAPVVVETSKRACLLQGKPSSGGPVLTWVKSAPPAQCFTVEEGEKAAAGPKFRPRVTKDLFLGIHKRTAFWPARDCAKAACPLVIHLHGFSDHATSWGYPQLMTSNTSTCAKELGAILLAPDIPIMEFLMTSASPMGVVDEVRRVVLPLIESFIADHRGLIDPRRVSIGGVSMGGHLALILGLLRPDLFSMIVATDCYLRPSVAWAEHAIRSWSNLSAPVRLSNVVVAYGSLDELRTFSYRLDSLSTLSTFGAFAKHVRFQLRIYEGRTHGTWNTVFLQWPDLYDVMFTQEVPLVEGPVTGV